MGGYHMFLSMRNETTNERYKKGLVNSKLQKWHKNQVRKGLVPKQEIRTEDIDISHEYDSESSSQKRSKSDSPPENRSTKKSTKAKSVIRNTSPKSKWFSKDKRYCQNVYNKGIIENLYQTFFCDSFIRRSMKNR